MSGEGASTEDAVDYQGVTVCRAREQSRHEALSLLLTGRRGGQPAVVDQFLLTARREGLSLEELWVASRDGHALASAMIVPGAGRAAMLFVSPVQESSLAGVTSRLVRQACVHQDSQRQRLIQVLLDPHQEAEARALEAGGFTRMAWLQYLQRGLSADAAAPELGTGLELRTWSDDQRPLFRQAILDSYSNSMDCPGLLGLRHIDDIIASHMAAGDFAPQMWSVLIDRSAGPVAVMLLNRVPGRDAVELVYLGVAESWRGRSLGKTLLHIGMAQAHERGATQMILAVDQDNQPAWRLYRQHGFVAHARKLAMIFVLPGSPLPT
jgi:mycothiol synthase